MTNDKLRKRGRNHDAKGNAAAARLCHLIILRREHGINYAGAVAKWLGAIAADFWTLPA